MSTRGTLPVPVPARVTPWSLPAHVCCVSGRHVSPPADQQLPVGRPRGVGSKVLCFFRRWDVSEIVLAGAGSPVRVYCPWAMAPWRGPAAGGRRKPSSVLGAAGNILTCPMHTCVSPGGCPHSDLPSGLPVCSPTSLERPLWVAASRPLSLANLCPGSHSSHSVSPRPVPSPPTAGPASLARLSPWDSSEPLFVPGHPVCSVSRSSSSQCL